MTGRNPGFLGSPGNTLISGTSRGQYVMICLHEVEDNREEIEEDPTLSTQGESPPHRDQLETPQSVRRP